MQSSATALILGIDPSRSSVSYSAAETLLTENQRLAQASGRTSEIKGFLTLNRADPARSQLSDFTVDLSTLRSDNGRRDDALRQTWLETARYPLAIFTARRLAGFPPNLQEGQAIPFQITGDLTVHQTTRSVTWDVTATLTQEMLAGQAVTLIQLADFGLEPPHLAGILQVTDGVTLTVTFVMLPTQ